MKSHFSALCLSVLLLSLGPSAFAQELNLPALDLKLCSPFLKTAIDDTEEQTDDQIQTSLTRVYDNEVREPLTSEQEVMDALYEEKWDLSTREPIQRNDLCAAEPNYVVHWADMIARDETGKTVLLAQGAFSFKKDGTFEFVFDKRPYTGTWEFKDAKMTLQADWMNNGEAVTAPVEKVQTPVEVLASDGTTSTYFEEGYRVGWMRFLRSETTRPGQFTDCVCSN